MNRPDRLVFGVVEAQMSDMEQTEILQGAINQAKTYNIDIAVISNIYNPVESSDVLEKENDIYDLTLSDKFDGFIFFSESVINAETQKKIIDKFKKLEK
ncbi:MAG TPA: LacI family transcriptional regulator, partial [Ruminococcus sp.]|nr:LacI family transcriptional regulator [Ruminococcus sp.]